MRSLALCLCLAGCNLPGTVDPLIAIIQDAVAHQVDPGAVDVAKDQRCDEQPDTYAEALAAMTVPIVEVKRLRPGTLTAAPMVLIVPKGWSEKPEDVKLIHLRHELTHYCQRRTFPGFDQLWLTGYVDRPCAVDDGECVGVVLPRSDYRAAFEIAAKRAAGEHIDAGQLTRQYLLHDLDPSGLQAMIDEATP